MHGRSISVGMIVALVAGLVVTGQASAQAQSPVADYQFQDTFSSSAGSAPALQEAIDPDDPQQLTFATETVNGTSRRVLRFPFDHGVSLQPASQVFDGQTYTIAVLARYEEILDFNNIVNLKFDGDDQAYYIINGALQLWPDTTDDEATITQNVFHQIIVTRDANALVSFYVDGVKVHEVDDAEGNGVTDLDDALLFFRDGGGIHNEASPGAVARIRIWDDPLTASAVSALDDHGPGPGQGGGGGGGEPVENCDPNDPNSTCGTTGDDQLESNDGVIEAGPGEDQITAVVDEETTSLVVNSGADADTVTLEIENVASTAEIVINGDAGNDTILIPSSPGSATPVLNAGDGNDVIRIQPAVGASEGFTALQAGTGGYEVVAGAGSDDVTAGTTNDMVNAGAGGDTVNASGGQDRVLGAGGPDELLGAGGGDSVDGGGGNDDMFGGAGKDVLHGAAGANEFSGGPGKDTCLSDTRKDTFRGCERIRRSHRRSHFPAPPRP